MSWERFDKLVAENPQAAIMALPRQRQDIEFRPIPPSVTTIAYTVSRTYIENPVDK